ncbi:MAG: DUF1634 domain-containing protein [Apilactobacillus sp.]|uniref:DUF1634 domain-containing protein n=1 Tax=Apilactobacillus TaxID=2767877 RepID=UPI0006B5247C|nr:MULTISPECIES: DUF1634 domain-containing protein [Apilactobacillus]KOY68434.1 Uncharacterized protein RZ74_09850 [Apilactobacillus apinorum]MCT6823274.1 DUF1634 domain-containing protein [Apilactobacillus sp.]MCT6858780.1 DUF1634 domain-containing protein [Apilactobacillus sp.]CAI2685416.1 Uncharacterized protein AAPFHON13_10750 [Apilactobacillus apinorum]
MNKEQPATKEEMGRIELVIGKILRVGVIISATIMILGLLLFLITGKSGYPTNVFPTKFHDIFTGIAHVKPYAIMMLGIFCLILTPVLRVIVSIYSFYKEKDMLYVWITTFVLIVLIISFFFG